MSRLERFVEGVRRLRGFPFGTLVVALALLAAVAPPTGRAEVGAGVERRTAAPSGTGVVAVADAERGAARVASVGIVVSDMERSIEFFRRVLEFELVRDVEVVGEPYERLTGVFGVRLRVVTMRLGTELVELTQYLAPRGRPIPVDAASNDRAFQHAAIIVSDMPAAYAHLRRHRVGFASTGPQTLPSWNENAGGIQAFYFRDPDDHVLEILAFPPDKGRARWHERSSDGVDRLFLGIDHTAIVSGSSARSVRFYAAALGFQVAGTSDNWGTEQEHLNNVRGARLHITGLRPPESDGPAIELLEYLAPTNGRAYPPDSRSNDVWHWHTTLEVGDLDATIRAIPTGDLRWISDGIVELPDAALGFRRAALLRDPDGHALRLVER